MDPLGPVTRVLDWWVVPWYLLVSKNFLVAGGLDATSTDPSSFSSSVRLFTSAAPGPKTFH